MKKFIYSLFLTALTFSFAACSDNDPKIEPDQPEKPDTPDTPDGPTPGPVQPVYNGLGIVNSGNLSGNIAGSLTYIDFENGSIIDDAFSKANEGAPIGDTFNAGIAYGDYIYLAVTNSAIIHVIDRETFAIVEQIQTNPDAGPRQLCVYNGMIYATLFGMPGYVIEIDPESLKITKTLEVGPLPEYIVACNDRLYVAVSDGYNSAGNYSESNVTVIDPKTFTISREITGLINPVQMATNGDRVFVCSWGSYDENWNQVNYGIYEVEDNNLKDIDCPGIYMAINDNLLYYIDAAYGASEVSYNIYDITEKTSSTWVKDAVDSPNGIAVNPSTGNIFILSYELGEGGYASYRTPGYVREFKADGSVVTDYKTGVGPTNMFFNISE